MSRAPRSVLGPSPISDEVRSATERLDLAERAAQLDRAPEFPRAEFRALGELRLLGLTVRSADGGRSLSPRDAASVLYEMAYSSGTTFAKLALQPEFCSLLGELGSEELRSAYYRPILEGRRLVGNHVTEPGAGSDAGA